MIRVAIKNVGKTRIHKGSGVSLPPPFHLLDIPPGGSVVSVCTAEQMEEQWPYRSGFRVSDLLRQLAQSGQITFDVHPVEGFAKQEKAIQDEVPVTGRHVSDFDDTQGFVEEPTEGLMAQGQGEDMSIHDEDGLPELVDPLYSVPQEKKKKSAKRARSQDLPSEVQDAVRERFAAEAKSQRNGSGIDLPDHSVEPVFVQKKDDPRKDKFDSAVKMAFIGAGQGGGRIAESFYNLGYRKVCAINTTNQDLVALDIPNQLVIGNDRGGAGKDPEQGRLAAKESFEDIMDLLMRSWGEDVETMFACVGLGGGSGTGSWPVVLRAMIEYAESTNIEKPITQHLGLIMTMPKRSEGSRVQRNALVALEQAIELVEAKKISSLIIVDNAKIHDLYPGLSVKKFWKVANQNFAAILHTFNLLAAKDSSYNTFDKQDLRSVIRNGMMIFGMARVHEWDSKEDVSVAVRQNLMGSLLADGFDLAKANMAGAIVVAHDDVLEEIPMEHIDYAFNSLGRSLGNEGVTLHSGIYEGNQPGMRVFTIVSGLERPQSRLEELERLST